MKIHRYLSCTTVNGPGKRFALWVQGCSRNCAGCFNPLTHDKNGGTEMSADDIIKLISSDIEGITISGGEPFEQPDELAKLLKLASMKKLHRLVYTGFCYEELLSLKTRGVDDCLLLTNMLIDGSYDASIAQTHPLSGSGNQRALVLDNGKIIKQIESPESISSHGEIIIDKNGNITATGFIDSRMIR
jgi:anaerobic ribonucleoside-triphosphate reductase activating protein